MARRPPCNDARIAGVASFPSTATSTAGAAGATGAAGAGKPQPVGEPGNDGSFVALKIANRLQKYMAMDQYLVIQFLGE